MIQVFQNLKDGDTFAVEKETRLRGCGGLDHFSERAELVGSVGQAQVSVPRSVEHNMALNQEKGAESGLGLNSRMDGRIV